MFVELVIIFLLVLLHELGHYTTAKFFKWRIEKIVLWLFGGVMIAEEHGSRPLHEEFLVILSGPFQHFVIYLMAHFLYMNEFLSLSIFQVILFYNQVIFWFNLLPVWPLDGGKLLYIICCYLFPFRKSYDGTIVASLTFSVGIMIIYFILFPFTLSVLLITIFLIFENRKEWKRRYYIFIRFLLNRTTDLYYFRKVTPIYVQTHDQLMHIFSKFYRDRRHIIYIRSNHLKNQKISEKECLDFYFEKQMYRQSIGYLMQKIV